MAKVNDKYYVPVEIDGKWELVENAPEERDFIDDGQDFYIMRYYAALESCTKYPTLESDRAYWKSKEGVKMTSDEFEFDPCCDYLCNGLCKEIGNTKYAVPLRGVDNESIQSPTTKELIEQEAGKPIISEAYNDDGTHSHWRLIDPATGDLLWTQSPEEDTHLWTGKVPFTTFALSLPKQDTSLYKKQPMYKVILQNDTYTYVLIEQMLTPDEYPYCQKYELYSKGFVPKCYPTLEADKDYWASNIERSLQDGEFYINENGCAMPPKQDNGDAWNEVIWHAEQLIKDLDGVFIGAIARSTLDKLKTSISKIK